ncbi:MAG: hypothetical protein QM786_03255 [Breznakibacter sp.]
MVRNQYFFSTKTALLPFIIPIMLLITANGFKDTGPKPYQTEICAYAIGSETKTFYMVKETDGLPLYYYQDIDQYPCTDSVCERMQLRVYWDIWGNFLKIATEGNQQLTKINHQPFSDKDYTTLHKLLSNPNCNLKHYKLDDLTEKESEHAYYNVDAVSSATVLNAGYESVKGAVKTCYTLWHIVNDSVPCRIRQMTNESLHTFAPSTPIRQLADLLSQSKVAPETARQWNAKTTEVNNLSILSCLLELNRKASFPDKTFQSQLSLSIVQNQHTPQEVAIYNYLLSSGLSGKSVSKYKVALGYFD